MHIKWSRLLGRNGVGVMSRGSPDTMPPCVRLSLRISWQKPFDRGYFGTADFVELQRRRMIDKMRQ